jgi:hypothetical protein
MSPRRYAALQNMANMGSGPESQTAAAMLARQSTMRSSPIRGAIGSGAKAPARLPVRGALGPGPSTGRGLAVRSGRPGTVGVGMGRTGGAARAVSNVPRSGSGIDLSRFAGNLTEDSFPKGKKPLMSMFGNMTPRKKIGIGLGLGVAAGVAMNRRGEGVSPGRQSNARY